MNDLETTREAKGNCRTEGGEEKWGIIPNDREKME